MQTPPAASFVRLLAAVILAIAAVHLTAVWYGWYDTHGWIDIPLHLAGGLFIGLLFYYLFALRLPLLARPSPHPFLALFIFGLGFVMLVGVLWEFYEFGASVFILHQHGLADAPGWIYADTLKDLANDGIGGSLALCGIWFAYEKKLHGAARQI
jgi:MFS superfamily sulfate permease-like transporter